MFETLVIWSPSAEKNRPSLQAPWPGNLQEQMTPVQRALVLLAVRADATVPGATSDTSLRRSIWYGLMMVDRFWETILYWQGMQQCIAMYCSMMILWCFYMFFMWHLCVTMRLMCVWYPRPSGYHPCQAGCGVLGTTSIQPWEGDSKKKITGKFPKIGFRPSKKRTSNENSPWIRDVVFFT